MQIDEKTLAEILKLGSQYFVPAAALLRALYSGIRGKLPEGILQIMAASFFSGITALVGHEQLDLKSVILGILGNTVFMAGLLSFIVIYLLRLPNRGIYWDGVVGVVIGLVSWLVWVFILDNPWPWWTIPFAAAAGGLIFIALRVLLRQIFRLVRIATYFIVLGVLLVMGAGAFLLIQTVLQAKP
jgi:hypothetical protein